MRTKMGERYREKDLCIIHAQHEFTVVRVGKDRFRNSGFVSRGWRPIHRGLMCDHRLSDMVWPLQRKAMLFLTSFNLCPKGYLNLFLICPESLKEVSHSVFPDSNIIHQIGPSVWDMGA